MSDTTEDDFLGGRLRVRQPARGYRSGIDPVLLAASVPAKTGDHVLEIGTGSGVALLCLMRRVSGLSAVGVERNTELAALARANSSANELAYEVVETDLRQLPADLRDFVTETNVVVGSTKIQIECLEERLLPGKASVRPCRP